MNPTTDPNWTIIPPDKHKDFEPKLATDEIWMGESGNWQGVLDDQKFDRFETYRRRIESKPEQSWWIPLVEKLPERNQPILVACVNESRIYGEGYPRPAAELSENGWTHWMPIVIPQLPTSPKSAAELAFEEFAKTHYLKNVYDRDDINHLGKEFYLAGFNQGKKSE